MKTFACCLVLFLGLLVVVGCPFAEAQTTKDDTKVGQLALSHPDIYPDEEVVVGELTVHIIENAKESDTFYTLDGSEPTPTENPRAIRYTSPLHFSQAGTVWVKVRAVPSAFQLDGNHIPSAVVEKKYTIKSTNISPPTAQPRGGYYRGQVTIDAQAGTKGTDATQTTKGDVTIKYLWKDANKQGEATVTKEDHWTDYSDDHIRQQKVGKHFLFLQSTSKKDESEKSPMSRFTYIITSPLVYDVSTECPKCNGKATANEYFTVSIQNANAESWMFLSYSSRCDISTKLAGTNRNPVDRHMPSSRFRIFEAAPAVFVCLEEGGSPFPVVPRSGADDQHFSVAKGFREVSSGVQKKQAEDAANIDKVQGPANRYDSNGVLIKSTSSTSNSGGGIGFFVMFILATGLIIYLVKASRSSNGGSMSTLHKAVVDDVHRLVGRGGSEPRGDGH